MMVCGEAAAVRVSTRQTADPVVSGRIFMQFVIGVVESKKVTAPEKVGVPVPPVTVRVAVNETSGV